jgi:hypothetical protein
MMEHGAKINGLVSMETEVMWCFME